ncbi:unnamed protein product, partial [Polarella glacialis]
VISENPAVLWSTSSSHVSPKRSRLGHASVAATLLDARGDLTVIVVIVVVVVVNGRGVLNVSAWLGVTIGDQPLLLLFSGLFTAVSMLF